jgi:hypothetical protein
MSGSRTLMNSPTTTTIAFSLPRAVFVPSVMASDPSFLWTIATSWRGQGTDLARLFEVCSAVAAMGDS